MENTNTPEIYASQKDELFRMRSKYISTQTFWGKSFGTRAVRKVSSHFKYVQNRSRDFDVNRQPVRKDLTTQPWTLTLPWG